MLEAKNNLNLCCVLLLVLIGYKSIEAIVCNRQLSHGGGAARRVRRAGAARTHRARALALARAHQRARHLRHGRDTHLW